MDDDILDLPTYLPNSLPEDDLNKTVPAADKNDASISRLEQVAEENPVSDEESKPSSNPVFIPGTTIKLETEEDIQKWIAERKKNWPSRNNIERKRQQMLEQSQDNSNDSVQEPKKRKLVDEQQTNTNNQKRPRNICRFFQQHGTCRFGNKCKNIHEKESDYKIINNIKVKVPKNFENPYYNPHNSSEKSSLYKMLVKKDQLELENNQFIDFLFYLDKKGLIKHDFDSS